MFPAALEGGAGMVPRKLARGEWKQLEELSVDLALAAPDL